MTTPTNLILTRVGNGVRLNWTCSGAHETDIYVSVDAGAYALLDTVTEGIVTYLDTNDYVTHTVKYKLKAKGSVAVSNFSNAVNDILEFVFTSTGDGSGCGTLNFMTNETVTATIDGTGKFYSNQEGTEDESTTKEFPSGVLTRVFVKVPSGAATLRIKNVITQWGEPVSGGPVLNDGWSTPIILNDDPDLQGLNYPSVSTDVGKMVFNTSINIFGLNTIYGNLTGHSQMIYMEIATGQSNHTAATHGATVTGDISGMVDLETLDVWDKTNFSGDIVGLVNLTAIWCGGLSSFTCSDITALTSLTTCIVYATNTVDLIGDISGMTSMIYLQINGATSHLSGSVAGLTNLAALNFGSGCTITIPNVTNLTKLSYLYTPAITWTATNLNQILADMWANKDIAKTLAIRLLNIEGTIASEGPSGQGLIDKAALQAYHSPDDNPVYAVWTIYTR